MILFLFYSSDTDTINDLPEAEPIETATNNSQRSVPVPVPAKQIVPPVKIIPIYPKGQTNIVQIDDILLNPGRKHRPQK